MQLLSVREDVGNTEKPGDLTRYPMPSSIDRSSPDDQSNGDQNRCRIPKPQSHLWGSDIVVPSCEFENNPI
jgi:hypothetical protein